MHRGSGPFAALGFVTWHGMAVERAAWAWAKYALLTPKELPARPQNLYYEAVCTPHRAKGIRREKGGHHGRTRS
ncbi:MAG: PrgI family protein [Eggerthellaceae bacterium]